MSAIAIYRFGLVLTISRQCDCLSSLPLYLTMYTCRARNRINAPRHAQRRENNFQRMDKCTITTIHTQHSNQRVLDLLLSLFSSKRFRSSLLQLSRHTSQTVLLGFLLPDRPDYHINVSRHVNSVLKGTVKQPQPNHTTQQEEGKRKRNGGYSLGRSLLLYSFNLPTKFSKSCCFPSRFSRLRRCSSGL